MRVARTTYRKRRAWELDNGAIRLTVTQGGGHIACLELRERPGINPLWSPVWNTVEPWAYKPRDAARYGTRLLASILGHNLCLGWFGGPSQDEQKAGMQCHGEASVAKWRLTDRSVSERRVSMSCSCELPAAGMSFARTLSSSRGSHTIHVEETIASRSRRDLPFTMAEHVTFSPPFLEKGVTVFDMPATKGHTYPLPFEKAQRMRTDTAFTWPKGPGVRGKAVDLRRIAADCRRSSDFSTQLMAPDRESAWFSAVNPRLGLLVAYHWRREDFPWVGNWEENYGRMGIPWAGKSLTRGMEFANTPFPMALRMTLDRGPFHGRPTFRWLPAKGRIRIAYDILLAPVTPAVKGVSDIQKRGNEFCLDLLT
jgi:hypothetical protein